MEKSEKSSVIAPVWLKSVLKGIITGIIVLFVCLFICAALINFEKLPVSSEFTISLFCISSAFLSAALVCSKSARKNKMLCALICCAAVFCLLLAAGFIMSSTAFSLRALIAYSVSALCSVLIGSLFSVMFFKN